MDEFQRLFAKAFAGIETLPPGDRSALCMAARNVLERQVLIGLPDADAELVAKAELGLREALLREKSIKLASSFEDEIQAALKTLFVTEANDSNDSAEASGPAHDSGTAALMQSIPERSPPIPAPAADAQANIATVSADGTKTYSKLRARIPKGWIVAAIPGRNTLLLAFNMEPDHPLGIALKPGLAEKLAKDLQDSASGRPRINAGIGENHARPPEK